MSCETTLSHRIDSSINHVDVNAQNISFGKKYSILDYTKVNATEKFQL